MINFNSSKTKQKIAAVIVIVIVAADVYKRQVDTQCRKLVHQMREELGDDRLRISFDEWNVWYAWYRAKSVNDGIFTASMLHMLIEEAGPSGIDMACHFEAVNEGAIRVEWEHAFLTPVSYTHLLCKFKKKRTKKRNKIRTIFR